MVDDNTNTTEEQESDENEEVSIDLEVFSKEELIGMLVQMNEKDMTFSEFMESCIDELVEKMDQRSK
jgi:hypothetical protein